MYKGFKVICVTPAGRARYLKLLIPYILSSDIVDEYHLWVNTTNLEDLDFIMKCEERFEKLKLIHLENLNPDGSHTIGWFFRKAIDEKTIYIRFDDDIVFVEDNFFEKFLDFRINNPQYFLIYPMIINNAICTYIMQELNRFKFGKKKKIKFKCMDKRAWADPHFAEYWHHVFLDHLNNDNLKQYKFDKKEIGTNRCSINCISWFGSEFHKFGGILPDRDEEQWISVIKPGELGKINCVYGEVLVAHFSFYTQRDYLDNHTDILENYKQICNQKFPNFRTN